MSIRKAICIASVAALCATSAAPPIALTGTASAQEAAETVRVNIVDRRGRAVRLRNLPAADQARVARLQEAVRAFARQNAAFIRVGIGIECTWPPLRCRLVIIVTWAQ